MERSRQTGPGDATILTLVSEIATIDQLLHARLQKSLPKGMAVSHFTVLNHLAVSASEKTPAQLARSFNLTKGALTNTLAKLEAAGSVHIRPDWDDGRRKFVSISPAGRRTLAHASSAVEPVFNEILKTIDPEELRAALPLLRKLRQSLASPVG
ncbi:MarR family winged helix-turn-helix transcriptional regulator [Algicella marina]|uniref:MarR family transcriptional regulator n=1 Tax=Algicella marina TaxID=2683284 RepID=A0A6P1T1W7_9RHOB|nr:MarR family transcriptional regulator [Algicella marina]QHQ36914.1 MarR family transcriptional regulator [Algicella marina]